jgi:hypothetical protein
MSHFAVLYIGNDLEFDFSKYDENLELPEYVKYTKEELIAKEKEEIEEYKNGRYAEYLADPIKYAEECNNNQGHLEYISEQFPKKLKMNDEQIYAETIKYYEEEELGPNGEVLSTYNPDSKWDWYEVGGRYAGRIAVKNGVEIDSAYVKDIDFSKMHRTEEDYNDAIRYWELVVEGAKPQNEEEEERIKFTWYKPEFYLERYKNKETYAECQSSFAMWAVIKDGVWYEKGQMGWWAMSNETHDEAVDWELNFFDRFIKDLPEDTLITVVDCHI